MQIFSKKNFFKKKNITHPSIFAGGILGSLQQQMMSLSTDADLQKNVASAADAVMQVSLSLREKEAAMITAHLNQVVLALERDAAMEAHSNAEAEYRQQTQRLAEIKELERNADAQYQGHKKKLRRLR